jgi:hypothetical protein
MSGRRTVTSAARPKRCRRDNCADWLQPRWRASNSLTRANGLVPLRRNDAESGAAGQLFGRSGLRSRIAQIDALSSGATADLTQGAH